MPNKDQGFRPSLAGEVPVRTNLTPLQRLVEVARCEGEPDGVLRKRGGHRYAAHLPLHLVIGPDRREAPVAVTTHNISESGLAFWHKRELRPRTQVWLREPDADGESNWIEAKVSYCRRGARGYLVGARFESSAFASPPQAESPPAGSVGPRGFCGRTVEAVRKRFRP